MVVGRVFSLLSLSPTTLIGAAAASSSSVACVTVLSAFAVAAVIADVDYGNLMFTLDLLEP